MPNTPCPCSPDKSLASCCGRYHQGACTPSAVALMRSRYSAFVLGLTDYIRDTTHPDQQNDLDMATIADWSHNSRWLGLKVHRHGPIPDQPLKHFVEFTAFWADTSGAAQQHHERSLFIKIQEHWYFIQPE